MRKRNRQLAPAVILALVSLVSGVPNSYARNAANYGPAVDGACQAFNGTSPFSDQGCGLCHTGNLGQRVEPEWTWWATGDLTAFCPTAVNQAPNGRIDAPATDQTVTAGDTVNFTGSASDPDGDPIAAYSWNFEGGAPDSSLQTPGNVQFNTPGTFTVTFTVTDARGLSDPTPDTRTVTVQPVDPGNRPPDGTIDTPTADQDISVGGAVTFAGSGIDPDGDLITFAWDFGGGAPDASVQNPGSVQFNIPGTFTVTFTVTDGFGLSDPTPDSRIVIVRANGGACTDTDNDGFATEGGICGPEDCDDTDPGINPGTAEVCADNLDNDCDLFIDDTDSECNGGDCIAELFGDDPVQVPLTVEIESAVWEAGERELSVRGSWPTLGALVTVTNAVTGEPLGTTVVERDDGQLEWEFERERPATVPCRVRVEIEGEFGERDVANAPADCVGSPTAPVNQTPVANDDTASTDEGVAVTIDVLANDSDPDGDSLTITTVSGAANGSLSASGTAVSYTPAPGFSGADSFIYTVSDGNGAEASATVAVIVRAAPPPPSLEVDIEEARWNRGRRELRVEGGNAPPGSTVFLYNASTLALLATATTESDGDWEFRLTSPSAVPCRVRVEIEIDGQAGVGEEAVARAPRDCQ